MDAQARSMRPAVAHFRRHRDKPLVPVESVGQQDSVFCMRMRTSKQNETRKNNFFYQSHRAPKKQLPVICSLTPGISERNNHASTMGFGAYMLLALDAFGPVSPLSTLNLIQKKFVAANPRAIVSVLMLALLTGCASDGEVRGRFDYDLRPPESRRQVNWPREPDTPRFRYVGELVGEPNFIDTSNENVSLLLRTAIQAGKWIAGLLTTNEKMLMLRPIHGMTDAADRVLVVDAGRNAIVVFGPQAEEAKQGDGELLIWSQAEAYKPFQSPIAIVPAWKDRLAVSDAKLKAVFLLDGKGQPVGKLGMGFVERPTGLAFDAVNGHLYVADTEASDIKVFAEDGSLLKTIGRPGSEPGELNAPTHLTFSDDRLYVSDTLNNRIQVFDAEGEFIRVIGEAGVYVGQLTRPKGVAVASDSKLTYIIESYFAHLLVYDEQGQFLLGIDGSGLIDGKFMLPAGVWLGKDGKIFVADMYNNRVVIFEYLETDD